MENEKIKFVIAGGGTAGWIAAIALREKFPNNPITVIESTQIGILGAGEGTTPHFVTFLLDHRIDLSDFIKNTKATIKNGIKFTNWHGDGSYYFHPFFESDEFNFGLNCKQFNDIRFSEFAVNTNGTHNLCLSYICSKQNKVKFNLENKDKNFKFVSSGAYALHFDARLVADYLKKIATSRGVKHIDAKIVSSNHHNETFNILSLNLDDGRIIDCDFVFDCTGFSKSLLGGVFKERWIDYKESLPVDRALPFFIQNNTEIIPPYTEAIAMKYGWVWKIPVQGRYGCGYVFDSSYISDDEAKKEVRELFGEVDFPRSFSFKAGFYENIWTKNCVALGLSSGFIEPLEATSIWVTLRSINILLTDKFKFGIINDDLELKKVYNQLVRETNEQIKDFIQLHYLTERNDSPFWREYRNKNKIVNSLLQYDEVENAEEYISLTLQQFGLFDSPHVFSGVRFFKKNIFEKHFSDYSDKQTYYKSVESFKNKMNFFADFRAVDHYKFLEYIKSTP